MTTTASRELTLSALVVGDVVGVSGRKDYEDTTANVTKITPSGQVVVTTAAGKEIRFNKDGRSIGGATWESFTLVPEYVIAERKERELLRRERNRKAREVKDKLAHAIGQHSNGYGDFSGLDDAEKVELIALIQGL